MQARLLGGLDEVEAGSDREHHGVVMAVVGALDLADDVAARDAPRQPDGVHGRFGAGVGEPDALEPEPAAQLLGQRTAGSVVTAKCVPDRAAPSMAATIAGMGVARGGGPEAVVEVDVLPTVDVPDLGAEPARQVDGVGVGRLERGRHPEGQ